jgi:hypothetical protein
VFGRLELEFEFCIQFVHHHPVLEMLLRGSKCLRPLQRRGLLGRCKRCKSLTGYACGILFARTFTAHRFTCNIDTKSCTLFFSPSLDFSFESRINLTDDSSYDTKTPRIRRGSPCKTSSRSTKKREEIFS